MYIVSGWLGGNAGRGAEITNKGAIVSKDFNCHKSKSIGRNPLNPDGLTGGVTPLHDTECFLQTLFSTFLWSFLILFIHPAAFVSRRPTAPFFGPAILPTNKSLIPPLLPLELEYTVLSRWN